MPHGHICRLVPEHGYGFLVDDSGLEWFFVRQGIRGGDFKMIWLDERVLFLAEWTPKGPRATDIHLEQTP
jgi:cold shock CspA family protein